MGATTRRGNGLFVGAALALELVHITRDPGSYDVLDLTVRVQQCRVVQVQAATGTNSFFRCCLLLLTCKALRKW
jgi:hypothetical protein